MKITAIVLLMCFPFFSGMVIRAQQPLHEATLIYQVTVTDLQDHHQVQDLQGIRYAIYLKGGQSRTEMNSPLGTESTIYDPRSSTGYIIKEYGGTKLLIHATHEEWDHHNAAYRNLSFSSEPGDYPIGNFNCKKATARTVGGITLAVYYDTSYLLLNKDYNLAFGGLQGLPVAFELEQGGHLYKYELLSLNTDPVSYSRFDIPTKGFRTISYAEFKSVSP